MEKRENVLEMQGISKYFPGVKALEDVDFTVRKGEIHALIGENGAGKSTLMKVLLGMYHPDEGNIVFKGENVRINSPHDALSKGISMIHQELSLVPERTVAENILIGREPKSVMPGFMSWKKLFADAQALLKQLNLDFYATDFVKDLSVAGQQMIEIARAVSYNAELIIMDEPTSALTDKEVDILFHIMGMLKSQGISIIFISHKLDEIFRIADRTTVLRDGTLIGVKDNEKFDKPALISMMVGRELNNIFPKEEVDLGEEVLRVENFRIDGVFEDISFDLKKGEILGFAGLMGSGRTEIMRALFGVDHLDEGEIYIKGSKVEIRHPKDAIGFGIGMVTEDRKEEGLALFRSVKENIAMATMGDYCKYGFIQAGKEVQTGNEYKKMLAIKTPHLNVNTNSLSGGNQQKVVIAKWLKTNPDILILDEPTRGIDVGAKSEIHKLMTSFVKQGMSIIMISSEMPEVLGMSDRIAVMHEGRIRAVLNRDEATQESIMKHAVGEDD